MSETYNAALRAELLIIAGRLAEGEPMTREEAEMTLPMLVIRLCAMQLSHTQIALIAVTLAKHIDG